MSYNILADSRSSSINYTSTKSWDYRKNVILKEIVAYDCEIIAIQNIDNFKEWWQPQLMLNGIIILKLILLLIFNTLTI